MEASTYPKWAAVNFYALGFLMVAPAVGQSMVRRTALMLDVEQAALYVVRSADGQYLSQADGAGTERLICKSLVCFEFCRYYIHSP